jgi:hypothetical protein
MTRAQAETLLVGRHRKVLAFLELSTATDGTNLDLADSLARAVRQLGGTTADPTTVSPEELTAVADAVGTDRLIDKAEILFLDHIIGNWDEVSYSLDGRSEQLNQLLDALLKTADRLKAAYAERHPADPGTMAAGGVIRGGRLCPTPWAGHRPGPYGYRRW